MTGREVFFKCTNAPSLSILAPHFPVTIGMSSRVYTEARERGQQVCAVYVMTMDGLLRRVPIEARRTKPTNQSFGIRQMVGSWAFPRGLLRRHRRRRGCLSLVSLQGSSSRAKG
jgi:hypothetical protein